jgi:type I restriction enzyme R subunit
LKKEIFDEPSVCETPAGMVAEKPATYGLNEEEKIALLVDLTQQVFLTVERELKLAGFWESIPARNKLKADIQKTLLQPPFVKLPRLLQNRAQIISRIMEIAEKNDNIILYAE